MVDFDFYNAFLSCLAFEITEISSPKWRTLNGNLALKMGRLGSAVVDIWGIWLKKDPDGAA